MQNLDTGKMAPCSAADEVREEGKVLQFRRVAPRFYVGEQMRLKGGVFAVQSIGRDAIILRGLLGTKPLAREMTTAEQCLPALQHIADVIGDIPVSVAALLSADNPTIEGMAARAIRFYGAAMAIKAENESKETSIITDQA